MRVEISEHTAITLWDDYVGDSGQPPTNLELKKFAQAVSDFTTRCGGGS